MDLLEIKGKQIKQLNSIQLTCLLKKLLYLEADAFDIPRSSQDVPLDICVSDGGEDGRIKWENGPSNADFIPNRFTLFQCKAQSNLVLPIGSATGKTISISYQYCSSF